ncbi:MAG: Fe-S cluster assembly protein SufD [Bacteroidales bacterium]|nr:Fe-S cluster assembly protein SufD [Bacteroidales bacterium]
MNLEEKLYNIYADNKDKLNMDIPDFIREYADIAANSIIKNGIPDKSYENYKYSDFSGFLNNGLEYSLEPEKTNIDLNEYWQCQVPDMDTQVILLSNAWYYEKNNLENKFPKGVIVCGLREAFVKYPEIVKKHYSKYLPQNKDGYIDLNTAIARDGVFIYVPKGVKIDKTIQLVNLIHGFANRAVMQRNLVVLEEDASLRMIICDHTLNRTQNFINSLTESYIGKNAHLEYYSIQNEPDTAALLNTLCFYQEANSHLTNLAFSLHGGSLRNNVYSTLAGERAHSNLYGLFLSDKKQRVDNYTYIDHKAPTCTSNELYKGILDDNARGAFSGKIMVRPDAQKTEAYQTNNNLCLTDTAKMRTKPQLEIYADDVKCSHGATVGQLDQEALFYLQSRGISKKEAKLMLMFAFANDIVRNIPVIPLKEQISGLVDNRLRGEFTECKHCLLNCSRNR